MVKPNRFYGHRRKYTENDHVSTQIAVDLKGRNIRTPKDRLVIHWKRETSTQQKQQSVEPLSTHKGNSTVITDFKRIKTWN